MASSKFPHDLRLIPPTIVALSRFFRVACNLRPPQRIQKTRQALLIEERCWHEDMAAFLKALVLPCRIVLLSQGCGFLDSTLVVELTSFIHDECGYPRLFFDYPPGYTWQMYGSVNFWGGFILAIAKVPQAVPLQAWQDKRRRRFKGIVRQHVVAKEPAASTPTRYST